MAHLGNIKSISNKLKNLILATAFVLTQFVVPASSLFTGTAAAAGEHCVIDTAGANDQPGQKDLTQLCVNYDNVPTTVSTKFNWDETGTSGANTMDACNLFDTDGDGNINYAVCLTTKNDPAQLQFFKTYSCGDDKIDRCTSPATEISSGSTVCTVTQVTNDPFANGSSAPKDTQGACTIQLSTVGGAGAKLVDVCSYPSNQPNSDPSDCVIARPNSAKLEVVKALVPSNDSGRFDLKINGTTYATDIGDGGTTGTQVVTVDNQHPTQTVLEQANSTTNATSLGNYTTAVVCKDLHGTGQVVGSSTPTGSQTRQLTLTITAESDVVCTFTNTRATGHITVTKVVNNNHGGTAKVADFPLYVGNTQVVSGASNSYTANQSYTVSETGGPSGYTQTGLSCKAQGSDTELTATFTLSADVNVNCVITNQDVAPKLTLVKEVSGGTASAGDWTLSATPSAGQTLSGAGGFANQDAVAGVNYALAETGGPSGYTASAWDCDGGALNGSTLTLSLADDVTCTITNTRDTGTVTVNKIINPANDNGLFNLKINGETNYTANNQGNGGSTGAQAVNTGNYTVSEIAGTNTSLGDYSSKYVCFDGNDQVAAGSATASTSFSVLKGHNVVCTFTNTRFGSISGVKAIVNADGSATNGDPSGWTIFLDTNNNGNLDNGELFTTTDGSGNFSFDHLLPDNYNIVEVLTNGWTQIYSPSAVTLGAGENSTGNNFGNFKNGSISGYKFNDINGNGTKDDNEPKLSGWTINLYDDQDQLLASKVTDSNGYEFANLAPGTYKVCEEGQSGWTQTSTPECYTVNIDESGESNLNIVFGNQGRGTITVKKNVDTNGDGVVDDFNVNNWSWDLSGNYINDANYQDNTTGTTKSDLPVDTYSIHEDQKANYHFVSVGCTDEDGAMTVTQAETTSVGLGVGKNVVCTFTNARDTGGLVLKKHVVNDNGGSADASDFSLHVKQNNGDVVGSPAAGSENGTKYDGLLTGTYVVSEETPLAGYTQTSIVCDGQETNEVVVAKDETKTCTITNDDIAPTLTLKKIVVNDNGGTATQDNFQAVLGGNNVNWDNSSTVMANSSYTLSESVLAGGEGYSASDWNCDGGTLTGSSIKLELDEDVTCTITNDDIAPQLTVYKFVDNQDTNLVKTSADFTMNVDGTNVSSSSFAGSAVGVNVTLAAGDYAVSEDADSQYTASYSEDCTGNIKVGESRVCVVVNTANRVLAINVVKSGPATANAGDKVTYTFTVTNPGNVPLSGLTVSDDVAGDGAVLQSGDVNHIGWLDPGETWIYTVDYTIPADQTASIVNTVTVCGSEGFLEQLERELSIEQPVDLQKVCDTDTHTTNINPPGQVLGETTELPNTGQSPLLSLIAGLVIMISAVAIRWFGRRQATSA